MVIVYYKVKTLENLHVNNLSIFPFYLHEMLNGDLLLDHFKCETNRYLFIFLKLNI